MSNLFKIFTYNKWLTLNLLFVLLIIAFPWCYRSVLNIDLIDYQHKFLEISKYSFLQSFKDNVFLLKLVSLFCSTENEFIVKILHNIGVLIFLAVGSIVFLQKQITYIIMLFWYTLFFNQFRELWGLSFGFLGFYLLKTNKTNYQWLSYLLLFLGFLIHHSIILFLPLYIIQKVSKSRLYIYIGLTSIIAVVLFFISSRYYWYFVKDQSSYPYLGILLVILVYYAVIHNKKSRYKNFFLVLFVILLGTMFNHSICSRISELSIVLMFLVDRSFDSQEQRRKNLLLRCVVASFFVYRLIKVGVKLSGPSLIENYI